MARTPADRPWRPQRIPEAGAVNGRYSPCGTSVAVTPGTTPPHGVASPAVALGVTGLNPALDGAIAAASGPAQTAHPVCGRAERSSIRRSAAVGVAAFVLYWGLTTRFHFDDRQSWYPVFIHQAQAERNKQLVREMFEHLPEAIVQSYMERRTEQCQS